MAELTAKAREFLGGPNLGALGWLAPDGSPRVSTVWVGLRKDRPLFNTRLGYHKERHLRLDPRLALTIHHHVELEDTVTILGRAAAFVEGDEAEADIDLLCKKYKGIFPYPWRSPGERRVTILVDPMRVSDTR